MKTRSDSPGFCPKTRTTPPYKNPFGRVTIYSSQRKRLTGTLKNTAYGSHTNNPELGRKLRVAAYARVSSNSEDQAHSFGAQNAYFSKLISENPNWELAGLGVSVLFEEQKIDTAESTGEMLTAIFATLAQAESESTSSRVRWGVQQSMRDGRASIQRSWPLQREIRPQRSAVLRRVRHGLPPRGVDTARREAHRVALLQPSGLRKEIL